MTSLASMIEDHLSTLHERLAQAVSRPQAHRPGDRRACTDDFLVATTQHLSAVTDIVLPAVRRHLPDSRDVSREFLRAAKRLERALVIAKAKQYGQAQNIGRAWDQVWGMVHDDLDAVAVLERDLATRLSASLPQTEMQRLGDLLAATALRSPTRPHPHLPHRGVAGKVVRSVWSRADRVWDEFEGRITQPLTPREAG
ncbi:hypothetical protein [Nocardioides humi]|uniref:Hemerythrin domain-containing protein n=1 Tax=Nocardioides humi TaxID=449461 RepID=A0ABN2A2Q3_9ACTN|nr:hypothetical protein [Nocardioides humi]